MNKLLVFLVLFGMLSSSAYAQEANKPKIIRKAAFADKTIALRDMTVIMPGERKRDWKDGIIKNQSVEMTFKENATPSIGEYQSIQSDMGSRSNKGPLLTIQGIGNVNGVYPPDTDGDVGPNHYFQMINLSFAIWDKAGNKLYGPVDNSTLWQGFIGPWTGSNDGDPIVMYDEDADRWVASQFAVNQSNGKSYELVAVSATGDPLGEYYRYAFEFDKFNDYPKLGVWNDGYYATFNFFDGNFIGAGVAAFERDKMLAGDPDANMVFFGYFQNNFSLQPSDIDGDLAPEGSPNYIATVNVFGSKQLEIYEFNVDWDNPGNSTYELGVSLNPGFFNANIDGVPQPGTTTKLDALAMMLMYRLAYRNFGTHETMVANHTVNVGANRAGIKWYELRKENGGDWYIYQQGVYAPNDGIHRWMGSIAISAQGTIALGYSAASNTHPASIRYTGRPANAPLGEMTYAEFEAVTGEGSQSGIDRWGDYASMSVDPVDDTTFWFTTEYMRGSWKTKIVKFDFAPIQPPMVVVEDDGYVCSDTIFSTTGYVEFAKSHLWTTSGDGILPSPELLTVKYIRGNNDLANGGFWLKLTVDGYEPGMQVADSLYVEITFTPTVDAGNDTIINVNSTFQTNASAQDYSALQWMSSGDGSFNDPTALETIYTPGSGDISNGEVDLTLYALPNQPCSFGEDDKVTLTLDPYLGLVEDFTNSEFSVVPNPSSGQFSVSLKNLKAQAELNIINTTGEVMFTEKINKSSYSRELDFRYLPTGIYVIQIQSGANTISEKVVIR